MEPVAAKRPQPDDATLRQFLLAQLGKSDRAELEARFFEDEECFERLLRIEEALIEGYVRKRLTSEEGASFERQYLGTHAGRQRIALAQATSTARSDSRWEELTARPTAWPVTVLGWIRAKPARLGAVVAAAAVLALIAGGTWAWNHDRLLRRDLFDATARLARQEKVEQDLRRQIARAREPAPQVARDSTLGQSSSRASGEKPTIGGRTTGSIVALALVPGLARDSFDQTPHLRLPRNTSLVVLQLLLPSSERYGSYRARVRTVDDADVWQQDLSPARPTSGADPLVVSIPARLLTPGEYLLTLQGVAGDRKPADLATYFFRIDRAR
jgi:hypothetical protein